MSSISNVHNSNKLKREDVSFFSCSNTSKQERIVRFVASILVLVSVALTALTSNVNWLWLSVFVGVNMLQSVFTKWCLLNNILSKLGIRN